MQKIFISLVAIGVLFALLVFAKPVLAQGVLPPLPTDYGDATATPTVDETATATPVVYRAATYTATATSVAQQVIDDAETGPVTVLLVILSLIGGIGFILIKRYFDEKKYLL